MEINWKSQYKLRVFYHLFHQLLLPCLDVDIPVKKVPESRQGLFINPMTLSQLTLLVKKIRQITSDNHPPKNLNDYWNKRGNGIFSEVIFPEIKVP